MSTVLQFAKQTVGSQKDVAHNKQCDQCGEWFISTFTSVSSWRFVGWSQKTGILS